MKNRPGPRPNAAFALACAGVLAAGMGAVFLAGRAGPGSQVSAASALPVLSAVGVESAEVQFWPWEFWDRQQAADPGEPHPTTGLDTGDWPADFLALFDWGWGQGPDASPGREYLADDGEGNCCLYVRDIRFADTPPQIAGLATTNAVQQPLQAELAVGDRGGRLAVSCLVYAQSGYDALPDGWQDAAVRRCLEEVLYLVNLSDDDQRVQMYHRFQSMLVYAPWALENAGVSLSRLDSFWQADGRQQLGAILEGMRWAIRDAQQLALEVTGNPGYGAGVDWGALHDHRPVYLTAEEGEGYLAPVLDSQGLDLQIIPQEKQVLVLFSASQGSVGVYWDPVLDCFSGYAIQA